MMLRKTKIICTLGPAVDNEDMIRALIRTGMNAARFNFSHGSHEEHLNRLNLPPSRYMGLHGPPGGGHPGHQGPGDPHPKL